MELKVVKFIITACTTFLTTDAVTFSVIGGMNDGEAFECNKTVILQCDAVADSILVRWQVGTSFIAADCDKDGCSNNLDGRYNFTYDKPSGVSNMTISPVASTDDQLRYLCNDLKAAKTHQAIVKSFPDNKTTDIKTNDETKTVTVITGCTLNVGNVTFSWFKFQDGNYSSRSHIKDTTPDTENCTSSPICNGTTLISEYTVNTTELGQQGEKYRIECNIVCSDPDAPGPVVITSDKTFAAGVDNTYSDGRLFMPCYGYTIILSTTSVASVIIFHACWWNLACQLVFGILLLPHVIVTVLAAYCKDDSCIDTRCLPCWTYCLLLTVILLGAIPLISVLKSSQVLITVHCLSRRRAILLGVLITIGAFTAIILSSAFCKAKEKWDYNTTSIVQENKTEQSWIYGLILLVMWLITTILTLVLAYRPNPRKGLWKRWEIVFIACGNICTFFGVVSVILTGYFTDYIDDGKLGVEHWQIYLIVTCCLKGLYITVVVVHVLREPVHLLDISNRELIVNSMQVQLQWKCRWSKIKTFVYKLENKAVIQGPVEVRCRTTTNKYDLLQCTVDKLKLNTYYTVCIYSKIWKIPCETKQLEFNTKVPPKPEKFRIKKTDTSVTLNWKKPAGTVTAPTYEVVYGRTDWPKERKLVDIRDKTTCFIEELMPETNYTIKLYAIYPSGKSDALVKEVLTKASKPNPPSNFRYIKVGGDYVILQWSPCQDIMKQKFRLTYFSTETKDKKWIEYDGSERIEYTVKSLHPGTEYMFDLATKVGKKTSEGSPVLVITTEGIKPPFDFECTGKTESNLTFTWAPSSNVLMQRFRLSYATKQTKCVKDIEHDGSKKVTYTVEDLEPGTEYMISLVSVVGTKISQTTPSIIEKTKGIKKKLEVENKDSNEMADTVGDLLPDTEYRFTLAATTGKTNSDNNPELLSKTKGRVRRPAKIADLSSISTGETT